MRRPLLPVDRDRRVRVVGGPLVAPLDLAAFRVHLDDAPARGRVLDGDVELPVEVGRAGGGRVAGVGLPQDLAVVERHRRDHAVVGADVEAPVRDRRRPVAAAVVVADRGRPVHRSVRRDRLHAAGVVGEHDRPVRRLYRAPLRGRVVAAVRRYLPRGLDALGYRRVDVSGVPEALSELSLHPVVGCFGRAIASV